MIARAAAKQKIGSVQNWHFRYIYVITHGKIPEQSKA